MSEGILTVVVATEPAQYVPLKVHEYSIRKAASREVDVRFATQGQVRKGGTKFGFVRFLVPSICNFEGRAVYTDPDQVMLGDVYELVEELDDDHAIGIVRNLEGSFAGKPVESRNETSVMVLDCEKLRDWDPETMFDRVVPNKATPGPEEIRYKDFIRLGWVDPSLIQEIDARWNHYNMVRDDSKLVHFSHVREQPWKSPRHPLTEYWEGWLADAMGAGYVTKSDIITAVMKLRIHPYFLKHVL